MKDNLIPRQAAVRLWWESSLETLHRVETENTDGKKSEIRLSKKDNALASVFFGRF